MKYLFRKDQENNIGIYIRAVIVFLVLMLVGETIFFLYLRRKISSEAEEFLKEDVREFSHQFELVIEGQFKELEDLAENFADDPDGITRDSVNILRMIGAEGEFVEVFAADTNGNLYCEEGVTLPEEVSEYLPQALEEERVFSKSFKDASTGKRAVIEAVPVMKDGEVIGAIGGTFILESIGEQLQGRRMPDSSSSILTEGDSTILFVDMDREVMTMSPGTLLFTFYEDKSYARGSSAEQMYEDFQNRETGIVEYTERTGQKWYLVYTPMDISDWMLACAVKVQKAQSAFKFVERAELVLLAFHLLLSFGLVFFILRKAMKRQDDLIEFANTDALTGVSNKKDTRDQIEKWVTSESCQTMQAFFMIDLDRFKYINDTFGHAVGDEVLRGVGRVLSETFREEDITGRIGGDEFVVLMRNISSFENAEAKAENLIEQIHQMEEQSLVNGNITCSIGIAFFPRDGRDYQALYKSADAALYLAKERGRDCYIVHES